MYSKYRNGGWDKEMAESTVEEGERVVSCMLVHVLIPCIFDGTETV
jgi:hypothetical protein